MGTKAIRRAVCRGGFCRRLFNLLRMTLGLWLRRRFGVRAYNRSVLYKTDPPYILIPNHVGFWDPFMVAVHTPHPIRYVVADSNFRNRVLGFLLNMIRAIPKTKGMRDLESIRRVMEAREQKSVICLFAEGRRTWDGKSLPLIYSTTKLVKLLKIPVIVPILDGMFFANPCWSPSIRPGPVTIRYTKLFDGPELRSMSTDDIYHQLSAILNHDDYESQRTRMAHYRSRRRAEHLEAVLYTCPACEAIGTLYSERHTLHCTSCGYTVQVNRYGFFEGVNGPAPFSTTVEWNEWQIRRLDQRIGTAMSNGPETLLFGDTGVKLSIGFRGERVHAVGFGRARCYLDRVEFLCRRPNRSLELGRGRLADLDFVETEHGLLFVMPISELSGWEVHTHERFEYFYRGILYQFGRLDDRFSGFKWFSTINILRGRDAQAAHVERRQPSDLSLMRRLP